MSTAELRDAAERLVLELGLTATRDVTAKREEASYLSGECRTTFAVYLHWPGRRESRTDCEMFEADTPEEVLEKIGRAYAPAAPDACAEYDPIAAGTVNT